VKTLIKLWGNCGEDKVQLYAFLLIRKLCVIAETGFYDYVVKVGGGFGRI